MGKWTPSYVDDVLHSKISIMVSGAIRRMAVEKEPSISYESFVNELDTGDSFTLSLVDILVKELAYRRTRATVSDRRLIAENTITGLRALANSTRLYPGRVSGRRARRAVNLTDYLAGPPTEMELEEDEELDVRYHVTGMEGVSVNSDLYDAFAASPWPPSNARRATASPPSAVEEWPALPLPDLTSTWPMPVASSAPPSSTHSQQGSLRLAARLRMVEFNDFTHRRRSSNREAIRELSNRESSGTHPNTGESVTEPRDGPTVSWNQSQGRRSFPFNRTRQHETMWSEVSDSSSADASEASGGRHAIEPISTPTLFDAPTTSDSYSRASPEAEDILIRAPRLRRRNMQTPAEPQSVVSNHTSPVIVYVSQPTGSSAETPPPARQLEDEPELPVVASSSNEEPIAYPTPGSSENETVSS